MSERLEMLKQARERMLEDRDGHLKVLAAPFDRDNSGRRRQIRRVSGTHRGARPRHRNAGDLVDLPDRCRWSRSAANKRTSGDFV